MAKVEAPNKAYSGVGPGGALFVDGVAECDDDAALNYYRAAGYAVDGATDNPVQTPEPPDPREVGQEVVGTRLRDAAVDPQPGDFLPPTNAGQDNPHGSTVVSPEIHASGPKGIRPGEVFVEDVDKQGEREAAFATSRLVEGEAMADAVAAETPDVEDRGALDLSDPGSAARGRENAEEVAEATATEPAKKTTARKRTTAQKS